MKNGSNAKATGLQKVSEAEKAQGSGVLYSRSFAASTIIFPPWVGCQFAVEYLAMLSADVGFPSYYQLRRIDLESSHVCKP